MIFYLNSFLCGSFRGQCSLAPLKSKEQWPLPCFSSYVCVIYLVLSFYSLWFCNFKSFLLCSVGRILITRGLNGFKCGFFFVCSFCFCFCFVFVLFCFVLFWFLVWFGLVWFGVFFFFFLLVFCLFVFCFCVVFAIFTIIMVQTYHSYDLLTIGCINKWT